jgi:hypothetical protein
MREIIAEMDPNHGARALGAVSTRHDAKRCGAVPCHVRSPVARDKTWLKITASKEKAPCCFYTAPINMASTYLTTAPKVLVTTTHRVFVVRLPLDLWKVCHFFVTKGILMLKACICHKWSELKQFILNNRGGDKGVDLVSVVKVRSVVSRVRWGDHVPKVRHRTCKVGVAVVVARVRLKDARPTHWKSRPHPKLK